MKNRFRCDCPFTSALDILGDKWLLVIIKQMLMEDKMTFKDFIESEEAIATNILTTKLKILEELDIIIKTKRPNNKKTNLYLLTDKGLALTPVLIELGMWSDDHLRDIHPSLLEGEGMELLRNNKAEFERKLKQNYKDKLGKTLYIH